MPAVDLSRFDVDPKILKLVPADMATKGVVPSHGPRKPPNNCNALQCGSVPPQGTNRAIFKSS